MRRSNSKRKKGSRGFWKGRKVLVTGADGFMGSHLAERLLKEGARVSVYVRGNSITGTIRHALKNLSAVEKALADILTGNIASADAIRLIRKNRPEVIFHLAADAYVPNSFEHPREVMESNLIGTMSVLEAALGLKGIRRIVSTSSSEIYGTAQYAPIDEDHPLNPSSPYAASKVAADRLAYAFWNTYHLPVAIIRPFNTFGPRHTYDVIPKFIDLALAGKPLTVYGDGSQSRDFTYVDDMVEAFLIMGRDREAVGRTVNFGTGRDVSVQRTAELVKKFTGTPSPIVHLRKRTSEVQRLVCDYGLARRFFGWRPRVSFEEGLRRNIAWARSR